MVEHAQQLHQGGLHASWSSTAGFSLGVESWGHSSTRNLQWTPSTTHAFPPSHTSCYSTRNHWSSKQNAFKWPELQSLCTPGRWPEGAQGTSKEGSCDGRFYAISIWNLNIFKTNEGWVLSLPFPASDDCSVFTDLGLLNRRIPLLIHAHDFSKLKWMTVYLLIFILIGEIVAIVRFVKRLEFLFLCIFSDSLWSLRFRCSLVLLFKFNVI